MMIASKIKQIALFIIKQKHWISAYAEMTKIRKIAMMEANGNETTIMRLIDIDQIRLCRYDAATCYLSNHAAP